MYRSQAQHKGIRELRRGGARRRNDVSREREGKRERNTKIADLRCLALMIVDRGVARLLDDVGHAVAQHGGARIGGQLQTGGM